MFFAVILSAFINVAAITDTIAIVDYFPPDVVAAAVSMPPAEIAIECGQPYTNSIQFIWRYEPGKFFDTREIEDRLTTVARQVNGLFWRDSNSRTEWRFPRWRTREDCTLDVLYVPGNADFVMRPATKYVIVMEDDYICGVSYMWLQDMPGLENLHNGSSLTWVASHCLNYYVVSHELLHAFGAVQESAPHSVPGHHSGQFDVMGAPSSDSCTEHDHIDCGNDDYWSLQPAPDSYLATHWNSADSVFLVRIQKYQTILPLIHKE